MPDLADNLSPRPSLRHACRVDRSARRRDDALNLRRVRHFISDVVLPRRGSRTMFNVRPRMKAIGAISMVRASRSARRLQHVITHRRADALRVDSLEIPGRLSFSRPRRRPARRSVSPSSPPERHRWAIAIVAIAGPIPTRCRGDPASVPPLMVFGDTRRCFRASGSREMVNRSTESFCYGSTAVFTPPTDTPSRNSDELAHDAIDCSRPRLAVHERSWPCVRCG